jgi:hypothetical protein
MANLQNFFRDATETADIGTTTHSQASVQNNNVPAQSTLSYPRAGLKSRTPQADQRIKNKIDLIDPVTGRTPFGTVVATDSDFQALEDKRKLAEEANFDAWLGENFHKGDVAARKWLQQTVPDYYAVREKEIDDRAEFAKMVAKVKLRGPQTTEEMVLVYGLSEGKIKLEPGWNVIGYVEPDAVNPTQADRQNRFASSLLGPMKYQSQYARTQNATNPVNPFRQAQGQAANAGGAMWPGVMGGANAGSNNAGNAGRDFQQMQQMFSLFSQ